MQRNRGKQSNGNIYTGSSLIAQQVKNISAMQETEEVWVQSLVRKIPWRRKRQPTPVFLPGKSRRQRNLVGHGLWGHREWDMTEYSMHVYTHTHKALSHITTYIYTRSKAKNDSLSQLWMLTSPRHSSFFTYIYIYILGVKEESLFLHIKTLSFKSL